MNAAPRRDCVFVGGIHGVGKSSLCNACAGSMGIASYTASELIRLHNDRDAGLYKEVVSVSGNQDTLLNALRALPADGSYLLDGHFVIRSKTAGISLIPSTTFEAIAPCGILLVTGDAETAAQRMLERDARCVTATELTEMQRLEIQQGRVVAQKLGVTIIELHSPTVSQFVSSVASLFNSGSGTR